MTEFIDLDLKPGDLVNVTIGKARVTEVNGNLVRYAYLAGGTEMHNSVHLGKGWPEHTITRVAPVEWPPSEGDVWGSANGGVWFACRDEHLITPGRSSCPAVQFIDAYGPVKLLFRKGRADG